MKSFTNIEQSKELAEILPIETADMKWYYWKSEIDALKTPTFGFSKTAAESYKNEVVYLPCWSLAALLNVLPLKLEYVYSDYELKIDMSDKMPRYVVYGDCYHDSFPWNFEKEDLLDNVVESIIWLHEQKLL